MAHKREVREQARQLRREGKSILEIHQMLGVAKSSVSLWVRDIKLSDEQFQYLDERKRLMMVSQNWAANANRKKFHLKRVEYQEEGRLRARERPTKLHMLGCLLYWAEGGKQRTRVFFVNSDPDMIRLFAQFLREELEVPDEWFTIYVRSHPKPADEIYAVEQYWLDLLKLPRSVLRKTHIREGGDRRQNRLDHGLCTIVIHDVRLMQHIYGAIQEYAGIDKPEWLG